jgi:lipopolysaccharide export system permease protein
VVKPLIAVAVIIVGLKVVNRELAIPAVREKLSYNAQDLGGSRGKQIIPRYDFRTGILLRASGQAYANEKRIEKPDFQLPPGLDRLGSRIIAEHAYYKSAQDGRPSGYLMREVSQPADFAQYPSLAINGGPPIVLTPKDTPWLAPTDCFVISDVSFEYLVANSNWRQLSSTWDLIRGLQNSSLDYGANERTAIHSRVVQPVLDLTLLFLGLPLVLTGSSRNVFMSIGVCLALVVAFMLVVVACNYLGSSYLLEPSLAAWLPLMIFVPTASALSLPLRS